MFRIQNSSRISLTAAGPEVSFARKIRDRSNEPGWPEYEFARAICRIKLDPQAKSKADIRSAIESDLKKAEDLKLDSDKRDRLDLDHEAEKWRKSP